MAIPTSSHAQDSILSVQHLILRYDGHLVPPEWNNEVDPTQWRELFRAFGKKALYMDYGLVGQHSRFLQPQPDEGESHLRICYPGCGRDDAFFAEFVYARQNAGCSVTVS
jgi:hypothetical protein